MRRPEKSLLLHTLFVVQLRLAAGYDPEVGSFHVARKAAFLALNLVDIRCPRMLDEYLKDENVKKIINMEVVRPDNETKTTNSTRRGRGLLQVAWPGQSDAVVEPSPTAPRTLAQRYNIFSSEGPAAKTSDVTQLLPSADPLPNMTTQVPPAATPAPGATTSATVGEAADASS
ncbi:hypothetical protein CYMTET_30084, partial [Cymbomonas tetramitiformis]